MCASDRMTASLRIRQAKPIQTLGRAVHQESPGSDIFRKRAKKPLLKQKHCQKHLTWAKKRNWTVAPGPKSSFQMKGNLKKKRSQSLEEEWRGTESMLLEVQCEVSTVSDDLGCHVICW